MSAPEAGNRRVVLESVRPEVDGGRYPAKAVVGELVEVHVDMFADGHDALSGVLMYRYQDDRSWSEVPLEPLGNDRWRASFPVTRLGRYRYTVEGWINAFATWRHGLGKKIEAGQNVSAELKTGAALLEAAAKRATGEDAVRLEERAGKLRAKASDLSRGEAVALDPETESLMARHPDRGLASRYARELEIIVDRERARFGAWYEMFPRSCAQEPGRHGTFRDCEARLAYVAGMGFDVVYLPPIHPIGRTHRKGKNNELVAGADDPGSPWAIGAREGGHKTVHPELGTLEDFERLVSRAREHGLEVAIDIAFQCSPDHPYVREHPEWFRHRPDGTIQYAENPPKKYQDIYPFDFESPHWESLWTELKDVLLFWIGQGIRIFRVDNPHTKPFPFWEWAISEIKKDYPETIFLSEAFTRPRVMHRLAKLGFSQSYTYFTWRNTSLEIREYMGELTRGEGRHYLRPNLWPNTPDILNQFLQAGGRPAFMSRLVLAATLAASYGIYGPVFELCENAPRDPGGEEYLGSEKYEIRHWDLDRPGSLREYIARVNRIRRENPALQSDHSLRFWDIDNPQMIAYTKNTDDLSNVILTVVNLDPYHTHSGWLELSLAPFDLDERRPYQVHDLLGGARFVWQGNRNYVELDPRVSPAQIFRLRRRLRTEQDFDYYL